jgi:hypothetical protein
VTEPTDSSVETRKKWRRRALIAGALLALGCKLLPADYQGPCATIAQVCSGGLLP